MGKKKMIQNYELLDTVGQVEDMYEIIKAKHVQQRKFYTLKKVKLKNDKNNRLYDGFLNEASLLKGLKHPNIAKSIKMMKTSTSIYVVYDYCDGVNLNEWMEKGSKRTLTEKQGIIKQLCLVVAQLRKAGISHLYLNPECIYVNETGDIKVTDFMYGMIMPDMQEEVQMHFRTPKSDFTAPQVKKGIACYESDIFSFGKILDFMQISNSKKGTLSLKDFNSKCEQLNQIVKSTTKKKSHERDTIDDVYRIIFKAKGKLRKMKSMSMSMSKIGGGKQSMLSKASMITTATGKQKAQFTQQIILKLLKRRNMSRLLVQLFKNTVQSNYPNLTDLLILNTLMLKKSTIILNSLGKFIKYGKGIQGLQLKQNERNKLFKSGDYIKMQPLIQAEVKVQKKQFQTTLEAIYLDSVKVLQNKKFNLQLKKQQIDEGYLRDMMRNFIITSVRQIDLESEHTNFLKAIYIMHLILEHGGIQIFFEKKITEFPTELMEQAPFLRINKQMKLQDFFDELEKYKTMEPT